MKVVIYKQDDAFKIMIPANNVYVPEGKDPLEKNDFIAPGEKQTSPPEGYRRATLEEIAERDVPEGCEWHVVEQEDLPQERHFRDAWDHTGGKPYICMVKAREKHKRDLRERRAYGLAKLDVDYIRADEAGNNSLKQQISQKKQALRDITNHPEIAAAQTPEQLKLAGLAVFDQIGV